MPRCADFTCGRWRPERLAPKWAAGLRFNGHWYCSRECVETAARVGLDTPAVPAASVAPLPPLKLGVLLRHLGAITESALESALESQRDSGRRLGAELQHLGLVDAEVVLKALAAQSGVSYLPSFDVNRVMAGPSWLPAETVRALGLVPFEADESQKRLRVICAPPVPRSAVRALLKLTGWTAEPYLVQDEVVAGRAQPVSPGAAEVRSASRGDDGQGRRGSRRARRRQRAARSLCDDARGELRSVHVGARRRRAAGLGSADSRDGGVMPGGAYSALSGMRTRLDELDRLAADLANVSTVGYKTERSAKRASERDEFAPQLESAVDVAMVGREDRLPAGHHRQHRARPGRGDRRQRVLRRGDAGGRALHAQRQLQPARRWNADDLDGRDGDRRERRDQAAERADQHQRQRHDHERHDRRGSIASRAVRLRERPNQGIGSDLQSFSGRDAGAGGSHGW